MPSISDICYTAGFFDGEGSVTISLYNERYVRIEVGCSQKYPAVLNWMKRTFGGNVYGTKMYQWKLHGEKGVAFLRLIRPYLIVKCVDADEAFDAWENRADVEKLIRILVARRERREQRDRAVVERAQ
jgi:hypothetical protein